MPKHFILAARSHPDGCVLDNYPSSLKALWQATVGMPLGAAYPSPPPDFEMSRRLGGKVLFDCVENTLSYLIVSERIRGVLEAHATTAIEYLPLRLLNHKKRYVSQAFYIANVLGQVDCADRARSRYVESSMRPGQFCDLTLLCLESARVDTKRNIFRLAQMPRVILVSEDLATALRDSQATGLDLLPLETQP